MDLFHIIDIIALDKDVGVVGVQSCGTAFSEHIKKMTVEYDYESIDWLRTKGTTLELWAWRKLKVKRGGKAVRYVPRVAQLSLSRDKLIWHEIEPFA